MFSNSLKYAIKAVLYLALNSDEENKLTVKNFSSKINVPHAYLAKLLQELSRQNLISSTKGPKGGFFLSEADKSQPLMRIIKAIEGEGKLSTCLLSMESCSESKPCPLHKTVAPFLNEFLAELEGKTICDLAKDVKEGKSYLPL